MPDILIEQVCPIEHLEISSACAPFYKSIENDTLDVKFISSIIKISYLILYLLKSHISYIIVSYVNYQVIIGIAITIKTFESNSIEIPSQ